MAVAATAADLGGDVLAERLRVGVGEIDPPAGAVALEAVVDVEVLLEVLAERHVGWSSPQGHQSSPGSGPLMAERVSGTATHPVRPTSAPASSLAPRSPCSASSARRRGRLYPPWRQLTREWVMWAGCNWLASQSGSET